MGIIIFWTDTARNQLRNIFDYYKHKASVSVARKIVKSLVDKTIILQTHPKIGPVETLLNHRDHEYRFLVKGHYKIIYRIHGDTIKVAAIFDCRQHPDKIRKTR